MDVDVSTTRMAVVEKGRRRKMRGESGSSIAMTVFEVWKVVSKYRERERERVQKGIAENPGNLDMERWVLNRSWHTCQNISANKDGG